MKYFPYDRVQVAVATLILTRGLLLASAQGRMHDKDIEATMKNLREDAKKFRSSFKSAASTSTLRKTNQEKDAKALVQQFEKQTEAMLKQFTSKRKADPGLDKPGTCFSALRGKRPARGAERRQRPVDYPAMTDSPPPEGPPAFVVNRRGDHLHTQPKRRALAGRAQHLSPTMLHRRQPNPDGGRSDTSEPSRFCVYFATRSRNE